MAVQPAPKIVLNNGQTDSQTEITTWLANLANEAEQASPRQRSARATRQFIESQKKKASPKNIDRTSPEASSASNFPTSPVDVGFMDPDEENEMVDTQEVVDRFQLPEPPVRVFPRDQVRVTKPNQQIDVSVPVIAQARPKTPPVELLVDFEFSGRLTVHYHDVIQVGMALVLVFDHSGQPLNRWEPPAPVEGQSSAPFAMMVRKADEVPMVYLAHYTGLTFRDGDREYFILTVEQAVETQD